MSSRREAQLAAARKTLLDEAALPLASNPKLRERLVDARREPRADHRHYLEGRGAEAGYSQAATERAKSDRQSWEQFIRDNKDEITALQILYSQPHGRVPFKDIKALADAIQAPPRSWTPELLWGAYEKLAQRQGEGRGHDAAADRHRVAGAVRAAAG